MVTSVAKVKMIEYLFCKYAKLILFLISRRNIIIFNIFEYHLYYEIIT